MHVLGVVGIHARMFLFFYVLLEYGGAFLSYVRIHFPEALMAAFIDKLFFFYAHIAVEWTTMFHLTFLLLLFLCLICRMQQMSLKKHSCVTRTRTALRIRFLVKKHSRIRIRCCSEHSIFFKYLLNKIRTSNVFCRNFVNKY